MTKPQYTILGGGSVTTEYYLPSFDRMGRLDDVTVVDPNASKHLFASHFADVKFCDQDYGNFLRSFVVPSVNTQKCAIVALPNQLHVDAVRLALDRGFHVLCEKPLALTARECAELNALSKKTGRLLKVAMSRRYLPSLMLARDLILAQLLGRVRSIEIRDCTPFLWRPKSFDFFSPTAGGILADMGVHYLDYLHSIVGSLKPLNYLDDAKGGTESSFTFNLTAENIHIEMRLSRLYSSEAYIKLSCERGDILINKAAENEVTVSPLASMRYCVRADQPFDHPAWPDDFRGSFCQMLADFERCLEGDETRIADAVAAEQSSALIEWAYEQRGRRHDVLRSSAQPLGRCKTLITGGTGFIGGHLIERLSQDAIEIRVTARTPASCANISRYPVEIVPINLLDLESVRAAVSGARFVYHLAYGNDGKEPARTTIEGTKNVVEAAIATGVECVVVLSTMYVFGYPQTDKTVDESFPYRPYGGEYGRSKATIEQWCLQRAETSHPARLVILNPTCVFGPGGGAYTNLPVDLAKEGRFCWVDGGIGLCNYSFVENLVDAMIVATQVVAAHGNRFIINDGAVSWRDFLDPLISQVATDIPNYTARELAQMPRYGGPFHFSDLLAAVLAAPEVRAIAKRSAVVRKMFSSLSSVGRSGSGMPRSAPRLPSDIPAKTTPPEWLASLYNSERVEFSAKKAHDVLGWQPQVDLAEAQAKTLRWLSETGRLHLASRPVRS